MNIFLTTKRMHLISFNDTDHHLIKELDSDPDVVRFISNGIPSDDREVNRAMSVFLNSYEQYENKFGYWKVINKETQSFMGWFHLRPLKSNPSDLSNLEIGYRLIKTYWGKGFATEGSLALIEYAKSFPETKQIWANTMLANKASLHVMQKIGLSFDHEEIYEDFPGDDKRSVWYRLVIKK
jgi:RimJ/RimL family protein N-acetyltransferase